MRKDWMGVIAGIAGWAVIGRLIFGHRLGPAIGNSFGSLREVDAYPARGPRPE